MSASTDIPDRFTFGIVISCPISSFRGATLSSVRIVGGCESLRSVSRADGPYDLMASNSATITNPRHRKRISLGEAAASRLSNRVSFPLRRTANAIAKRSNSVKSGTQSAKFVMTAMILRTDRYGRLNFYKMPEGASPPPQGESLGPHLLTLMYWDGALRLNDVTRIGKSSS